MPNIVEVLGRIFTRMLPQNVDPAGVIVHESYGRGFKLSHREFNIASTQHLLCRTLCCELRSYTTLLFKDILLPQCTLTSCHSSWCAAAALRRLFPSSPGLSFNGQCLQNDSIVSFITHAPAQKK